MFSSRKPSLNAEGGEDDAVNGNTYAQRMPRCTKVQAVDLHLGQDCRCCQIMNGAALLDCI